LPAIVLGQIEDLSNSYQKLGVIGFLIVVGALVTLGLLYLAHRLLNSNDSETKAREAVNAKNAEVAVSLVGTVNELLKEHNRTISALADRVEASNGNSQLIIPIATEGRDFAKLASEKASAAYEGIEGHDRSIREFALEMFGKQEQQLNAIMDGIGTQTELSQEVRAILRTIADSQANDKAKYDSLIQENNQRLQLLKAETTEQYSKLAAKVLDFAVVASGTQPVEPVTGENGAPK
jgi:hypothetical protein